MNNMCVLDNWVGYDYKSIALPAELQGLLYFHLTITVKVQINQWIKSKVFFIQLRI
jgi:hypothetical protein